MKYSDHRAYGVHNDKPHIYRVGKHWICMYKGWGSSGISPVAAYEQRMRLA